MSPSGKFFNTWRVHTLLKGWVFIKDVALSKPFTWVKLQSSLRKRQLKCRKNRNLVQLVIIAHYYNKHSKVGPHIHIKSAQCRRRSFSLRSTSSERKNTRVIDNRLCYINKNFDGFVLEETENFLVLQVLAALNLKLM